MNALSSCQPPPDTKEILLRIPPTLPCIGASLDFAEALARGIGFADEKQTQIRLALEETLLFFINTAFIQDQDQPVTLMFLPRADGLMIQITVKGLPIDIHRLPSFSPENLLDNKKLNSLSLHLAKKFMDTIEFTNHGRSGISVELLKRRSSSHISRIVKKQPQKTMAAQEARHKKIPPYIIRPAKADETLEISRCAFLTYGYTYEDYIYYPERITEMNLSGELVSLVAVSHGGKIMGHCGLKFPQKRRDSAELGVLFVNPEFRKNRLGATLWKAVVAFAQKNGLDSIFSRSVTGHAASQRMAQQNGFSDCALFLGLFPEAVELKQMGGMQKGKMSGMFQWRGFKHPRKRFIELPKPYITIARKLYERAGLDLDCHSPLGQPHASPLLRIKRVPVLNVGILEIESIGPDAQMTANWALDNCRRLCRERLDVIYLYISIEETGGAFIAEKAVENQFIFSGIIPDAFARGDAIVLQHLNLAENPFENMTVWTDTAALLRDFIHREWQENET